MFVETISFQYVEKLSTYNFHRIKALLQALIMPLPETPHRRRNPLTGDFVQVSPHRMLRPWQGQQEDGYHSARPVYDANCYLCPGNNRSSGAANPRYDGTFIFDNDFPALLGAADLPTNPV